MPDNYNSKFTGTQVDNAVELMKDKGVSVKDAADGLTENNLIVGDSGTRTVKSSTISISAVSVAISDAQSAAETGVAVANQGVALTSGNLVKGNGTHQVAISDITETDVSTAITRAGDYNTNGLKNGPKVDSSSDLTNGNLVAYGGSNKIVDGGVPASTISTMTVGVDSDGFLMLDEIPGVRQDSVLNITAKLSNASGSRIGTAILYYGRNFCDINSMKGSFNNSSVINMSSLVGQRDSSYHVGTAANTLFTPAISGTGFVTATTSNYTNAKKIDLKYNHTYLVMFKIVLNATIHANDDSAYVPSAIGFYNNGSSLGSVTPIADSGNTKTGTNTYYAVINTGWAGYTAGTSDVKSCWVYLQDGNAGLSGDASGGTGGTTYDEVLSCVVVDLSYCGDDAYSYDATHYGTDRTFTDAQCYAKYLASYTNLAGGGSIQSTKAFGPYYGSAMDYFRPYRRNWFVRVPAGMKMYIKEHMSEYNGAPAGLVKNMCLLPGNYKIALSQDVVLGNASLVFMFGKVGISDSITASDVPDGTSGSTSPLFQYLPMEDIDKDNTTLANKYGWTVRVAAINLRNGATMTANGINSTDVYNSTNGWTSNSEVTATFDLGSLTSDTSTVLAVGSISFQTLNGATFAFGGSALDTSKTRISYAINSVNGTILQVSEKADAVANNSVISTLPTAEGIYKYEVSPEGSSGSWTKEEETVTKVTLDNYNKALTQNLGISVVLTEMASSTFANKNYDVSLNDPTVSLLLELLMQSGCLTDINPVVLHHIVSKGLARKFFEYGDIIKIKKSDNSTIVDFQVIGFDEEEFEDESIKHSLTICQKYAPGFRWDMEELLFYASTAIPVGDYYIEFKNGQYGGGTTEDGFVSFHVNTEIPIGGGFRLPAAGAWRSSYNFSNLIGANKITTYGEPNVNGVRSSIESLTTTEGQNGTYLGRFTFVDKTIHDAPGASFGAQYYNYTGRNAYGSNNYLTSDIRKYINSDADAGSWWYPQTIFDLRHPSYASAG